MEIDEDVFDHILWKVMQLVRRNTSRIPKPIGNMADELVKCPQMDALESRINEIQAELDQFYALKKELLTSPSPVQKLVDELETLKQKNNERKQLQEMFRSH